MHIDTFYRYIIHTLIYILCRCKYGIYAIYTHAFPPTKWPPGCLIFQEGMKPMCLKQIAVCFLCFPNLPWVPRETRCMFSRALGEDVEERIKGKSGRCLVGGFRGEELFCSNLFHIFFNTLIYGQFFNRLFFPTGIWSMFKHIHLWMYLNRVTEWKGPVLCGPQSGYRTSP